MRRTAFDLGKGRDTRVLQRSASTDSEDRAKLGTASDDKGEDHKIDVDLDACTEKVHPRDKKPVEELLKQVSTQAPSCKLRRISTSCKLRYIGCVNSVIIDAGSRIR